MQVALAIIKKIIGLPLKLVQHDLNNIHIRLEAKSCSNYKELAIFI